jgi:hypothetical protein
MQNEAEPMIRGAVNAQREAIVALRVRGRLAQRRKLRQSLIQDLPRH